MVDRRSVVAEAALVVFDRFASGIGDGIKKRVFHRQSASGQGGRGWPIKFVPEVLPEVLPPPAGEP